MTANQAYHKLIKKWPALDAIECHEYETVFVFMVVPRMFSGAKNTTKRMGNLCSVNKSTGAVQTFQPFFIPVKEYQNGKKVSKFK